MTNLEKLLAIVLIIGTIFGIITTIPTMIDIIKKPDVWNNGIVQALFFISILGIFMVLNIFLVVFMVKTIRFFVYRLLAKSKIDASLLEESKTNVGEDVLFNVKFNAELINGYFTIKIRSPFWEEKENKIRFDEDKKIGQLRGRYDNRTTKLKCNIPSNFSSGDYDIIISIFDVHDWLFSITTTRLIKSQTLKIKINPQLNE